jgi:hypothetical protein
MHTLQFQPAAAPACVVESHAIVEVPLTEVRALRDAPSPAGAPALPPRFLRHCDEHTVVGVRAVLEAIAAMPEPTASFARYGVIGAPLQAGRIAAAQTLSQVAKSGGIAVSPHIVPQCSLHALASAVSVALGMHGPNIGTSGGPEALSEGLFAALSLVRSAGCDGLWLVFTEWDEEPILDDAGAATNDPLCRAVAVAIRPHTATDTGAVTLSLTSADTAVHRDAAARPSGSALAAFAWALGTCAAGGAIASWVHECPWGAEIRIASAAQAARSARPQAAEHMRREAA